MTTETFAASAPDSPRPEYPGLFESLHQKAQTLFSVGASPAAKARLFAAMEERQKSLGLSDFNVYAARLRADDEEWAHLWPRALAWQSLVLDAASQFEVAGEVISEWGVSAADRELKVLSLGAGPGYECASLAIMLEETGLRQKDWNVEIYALDLNPSAVEGCRNPVFTEDELVWLSAVQRRKWFAPRASSFAFKSHLGAPVTAASGNAFDVDEWPWPELLGRFDVIFCRGLTWEAPAGALKKLALSLRRALAPVGFIFMAPGEVLPEESGDWDMEERRGVVWYRRGPRRMKTNKGHTSKKELRLAKSRAEAAPENTTEPLELRERSLLMEAESLLRSGQPDEARALVVELIVGAQNRGVFMGPALKVMAGIEETLERPESAQALSRLAGLY